MPDKRELEAEFIKYWKEDGWDSFYNDHDDELFLGIRHNIVNLYYRGYSLCKIELKGRKNKKYLCGKIHKQYLGETTKEKSDLYREISLEKLKSEYKKIIAAMENENDNNLERIAQQRLILQNNSNPEAKWYCVDMEYIQARNSKKEDLYGRADILAVSKEYPGKTALIELKYGTNSISDGKKKSGAFKHMKDFYLLMQNDKAKSFLRENICTIINSYQKLNNDSSFLSNYKDAEFKPVIYFITLDSKLDDKNNNAQKQMQKYLLAGLGCSQNYNFQKKYNIDVTDKTGNFYADFLFSNDDGSNINSILDPQKYELHELK